MDVKPITEKYVGKTSKEKVLVNKKEDGTFLSLGKWPWSEKELEGTLMCTNHQYIRADRYTSVIGSKRLMNFLLNVW